MDKRAQTEITSVERNKSTIEKNSINLIEQPPSDAISLNYLAEHGIINLQRVQTELIMAERKELLQEHPYQIWKGQNNYWYTYLPDEEKGRVLKKRTTQKAIEDVVIEYIRIHKQVYIKDVFNEWIEQKLEYGEIRKQSYDRYHTDFDRFFSKAQIAKKPFQNITEEDLEEFVKKSVSDFCLTMKTFSMLRLLINGIFKYAKKKKYTNISITQFFGDLELSKNIFTKKIKRKEDEIFSEDEIPRIVSYIKANPTIWNLGVLLVFLTGMRVGELATLKKTDIDGKFIHVKRTEVKYKDKETGKWLVDIQEYGKTAKSTRDIILVESASKVIDEIIKLNPKGDYLFMNEGKRIRENTFNKRISGICNELHINQRSIHKARKTYGTTLIDAGVDDSIIMEQMGHTNIGTTRKFYYYSNKNETHRREQIEKAIVI